MRRAFERSLSLLLALCLLLGAAALAEGLTMEDEAWASDDRAILAEPVEAAGDEAGEDDLWTPEMAEAEEQAVAGSEDESPLEIFFYGFEDRSAPVINVPDPIMEGSTGYSTLAEGDFWLKEGETATCRSDDESVATATIKPGYGTKYTCTVQAVGRGETTVTVETSTGRTASAKVMVIPFEYLPVDDATFPDATFRDFILNKFREVLKDGYLLPSTAIKDTRKIDGYWKQNEFGGTNYVTLTGAGSLKGIEYFTELRELYASHNDMTEVDLSKNTCLEIVNLAYCGKLRKLDVSGCVNLEALQVTNSMLSALDVSHCPDLYVLVCDSSELTGLDVTHCPRLRVIKADANELTSLDVSHCPELLELMCTYNEIKSLDISNCPTMIRCFQNGGRLEEEYSYETIRGNPFYSTSKVLSYDRTATSIVVNGTTYTPAPAATPTSTPAPTKVIAVTDSPTPAPTPKPTGSAKPTEKPDDDSTVTYKGGVYRIEPLSETATYLRPAKSAKTVKIPAEITVDGRKIVVFAIAEKAFYNDKKLTKLTIGKNVWDIGANAFAGCVKLKTVKGGAGLDRIGDNAFRGCKALKAFTLSDTVSIIGKAAFYGCKSLKTFTIKTTLLESNYVGKNAFKGTPAGATYKCPKKKLKAYKALLIKKGASKKATFK